MIVAIGSSSGRRLFGTTRLVRIQQWSNTTPSTGSVPGLQATQLALYCSFPDRANAPPPQVFEAVGSYDKPGHICVRPGVLSQLGTSVAAYASPWIVFSSNGQAGDVVEVTVEFSWLNIVTNGVTAVTTAGTTAGALYFNSHLDNTSTAGTAGTRFLDTVTGFATAVALG
jgi:hypothetical protein